MNFFIFWRMKSRIEISHKNLVMGVLNISNKTFFCVDVITHTSTPDMQNMLWLQRNQNVTFLKSFFKFNPAVLQSPRFLMGWGGVTFAFPSLAFMMTLIACEPSGLNNACQKCWGSFFFPHANPA